VSLAPALISIYDRAVATSGGDGEAEKPAAGCRVRADADAEARGGDIDRPATSSSRGSTVVKRTSSTAGVMALPGAASRPEADMKKRPLSIRSTSSTASTASVTQRRRRKKQAVGDGVVAGSRDAAEVDLAPVSERLRQQAASYVDELNSLTSSLLEPHSESESSGGGGGAVRLSSLLTDDEELEAADVSPSSDCSDAGRPLRQRSTSESYVDMVVAEILDTERTYVSDLRDVVQVIIIIMLCLFQFFSLKPRDWLGRTYLQHDLFCVG